MAPKQENIMSANTARDAGIIAYSIGIDISFNPYEPDSDENTEWAAGWWDANLGRNGCGARITATKADVYELMMRAGE